ncbi:asparagine synthetase B [Paenibacillus sp. N4]|uniref:asparagine synthase-related protein n=1 Tax=Paenibacillus vietnamensis TaxID=2590547 RepID=UPI001CD12CAF|nr:asparagine synthase-related protein [Paenibacillus vietnamensis]MCA0755405.1 asparagine synthetase B [Paenibacillus vietnamensis]
MSAIAGIYHLDAEPINPEQAGILMGAFAKYPADDTQTWRQDSIFLGCHAQWITPESVGEHNPCYDPDRRLAIAADAVIDNREELFERLNIERGAGKEMTDGELILQAYDRWGEEAPRYLLGDFAFLIWDGRRRVLFGARDFSGSRTLYYFKNQNRAAFCTLMMPLLGLPYVGKGLNEQWLAEYLANPGVIETVDDSSTVFEQIRQVPPAHSITICDGRILLSRYVTITEGEKLKLRSDKEYEEAFLYVLRNAVTARLRTHRSVGAFLSGGLDSGSVVSLAAKELQKGSRKLRTYSYIPVDDYIDWTSARLLPDERPYIQSTVRHVGNITDHYLDCKGKSSLTEVDGWLDMLEMPYKVFENSFWIQGINEQAQRHGVGILLSGARGNSTISWGSALSHYATLLRELKWLRLYREMKLYSRNVGIGKVDFMKTVAKKAYPFMDRTDHELHRYKYPELINPELAERTGVHGRLKAHGIDTDGFSVPSNIYEARKKHFEQTYTWNLNGICGTKMSLRYGVLSRDPTNDLNVIRFCLSVPEEQYVRNGMDRALIRRSTASLLPDQVRLNQRVRGIQGADGIQRMASAWPSFTEELQRLSEDPYVSEYINVPVVRDALSKIRDSRPESIYDANYNILMRSLIVYRFLKKYA